MALFLSLAGRGSASIRRMVLYVHRERQIESIINATKRFRLRYCAVAVAILVAACLVALLCREWIFGTHQHARIWVLVALFVFFGEPLGENLWRGKSRPERLEQSLRRTKVELSAEGGVQVWHRFTEATGAERDSARRRDLVGSLPADDESLSLDPHPRKNRRL